MKISWIFFNKSLRKTYGNGMSKGQLNIDILGTSFAIQADESNEYLNQIYNHYTAVIEQVKRNSFVTDPLKLAIIAGILVTDEFYKEQVKPIAKNGGSISADCDISEIEQSTKRMMKKIDTVLNEQYDENLG